MSERSRASMVGDPLLGLAGPHELPVLPHDPSDPATRPTARPVLDPITATELDARLAARRRHPSRRGRTRTRSAQPASMGYQPALDGLRALSVVAVILYHGGFGWARGGFFGVDVFFAVSGFLITTLLLEERERTERVSLRDFWARRARRLLPALAALLATVAIVAALAGTPGQLSTLRRDLPWAIFYVSNWGQILGEIPYWAADPPLLRHLWTLAIEEQFYILWPLAFLGLARLRTRTAAGVLVGLAAATWVAMFVIHGGGAAPMGGWFAGADRTNFNYLSTVTRAAPLLLGSAAAFVWQPWHRRRLPAGKLQRLGRSLDGAGTALLAVFGCAAASAVITAGYVYQWLLPLMSLVVTGLVIVVVDPAARRVRQLLSWPPLVAIGQRSYGLYLWHWPIFVFAGAHDGRVGPFLVSVAIAAVLSEISYRFVETPVRTRALERWWRGALARTKQTFVLAGAALVVVLFGVYARVQPYDPAVGAQSADFVRPDAPPAADAGAPAANAAPTTAAAPPAALRLAIVGDSQAHSLAANEPDGLDSTFDVTDGAVDGCSVYDEGQVITARPRFGRDFAGCQGWQDEWVEAAQGAQVALVVLGAWDVFDLRMPSGDVLTFGSPAWDSYVSANLQSGIDALAATGARVALLEAPCMRPQDVASAGVPALPERADDQRIAHVNELWRSVAAANPATTTFVEGPNEWCEDEALSSSLNMRWDGVHVHQSGAKLIYETIALTLLDLAE